MPRPKKIKSPEDFGKEFEKLKITKPTPYDNMPCGNPYIEERDVEEDKQTIPTEKKYSPEVEAVGGGITIFGDREMTEKVEEELKKYDNQMGKTDLSDLPETKFEKASKEVIKEATALEVLQELEKKLRACTDETPRDIRYKIECNRFILVLQYNSIEVRGDVFYPEMLKGIYIDFRKSELATAQKMREVLKEWRDEQ